MNQQTSDQGWQRLQAHIEDFVGQALRDDVQRIEYKPLFSVKLLEMSSERNQNEIRGVVAKGFSQRGGGT